jgi:YidC/Oxa1 family membrane protein insertase
MDKRTLISVIFLALMLFGANLYFNSQRDHKARLKRQQEVSLRQVEEKQLIAESLEKRAAPSQLPLVALTDQEGGAATGIRLDQSFLLLNKWESLPAQLMEQGQEISHPLYAGKHELGSPLLFGQGDVDLTSLPKEGSYDLQLVSLNSEGETTIAYARLSRGLLSIPVDAPQGNAIALWKGPKGYRPVGLYKANEPKLLSLAQLLGQNEEVANQLVPQEKSTPEQKFYVLENGYQQFVFTNIGGALYEINLPFQGEDQVSIVKEIGFDREMEQNYPWNDYFPNYPYYLPGDSATGPFVEVTERQLDSYYPLLRRNLIDVKEGKTLQVPPRYYALNLISKHPELSELNYKVTYFDENRIVMEATQPHRKITKTFSLPKDSTASPYVLDVEIQVEGSSEELWLTTGVPEVEMLGNKPAAALKYRLLRNQKGEMEKIGLPKLGKPIAVQSVYPDWIVNANAFFGVILDPLSEMGTGYRAEFVPNTVVPSRLQEFNSDSQRFKQNDLSGYIMQLPLRTSGGTMKFRYFAGPLQSSLLKGLDKTYTDAETGLSPDYAGAKTFHGIFKFISAPFSKLLWVIMEGIYFVTRSWGLSIILLTVVLRLLLYPLNTWSLKSMRRMQKLQPEIQKIQEKNKKDPRKGQMEVMNLYRQKKVNPLMGCVPMLIQMPFLIAMFDLLKSSFDLRGASFIPGWIDNLTAPDVLFSWSRPIFFFGTSFHLLPILLGAVMFIQQRFMGAKLPKDKSLWTEQQRQQRMMGLFMTVIFTVLFYNFASGLNIYWLSSMALSILQQWLINRKLDREDSAPASITPSKLPRQGGQKGSAKGKPSKRAAHRNG